jgi:SAM-dependent methyltransferase
MKNPFRSPFGLLSKNWLVWRIGRRHVATVSHLARGEVLDIGCGEQPFRSVFDGRIGRIWGLDHPRTLHPNEKIEVFGTALSLPFRGGSFDTAICFQVLEHVPEPLRLLEEARRVLKPGSHLILTAPHIWNVHEQPHDYFRYTQFGLEHLFRKAGFEVVEVRPMAGYFVTAAARFCYFLAHFDRWGLQIVTRPLFLIVQCGGWALDKVYCDTTETWNYLAVGRVPGRDAGPAPRAT